MKNPFKTLPTPSHLLHCVKVFVIIRQAEVTRRAILMVLACFLVLKGFHCVASIAELLMKGLPHERPCTPPLRQIPPPPCNEPLNKWSWLLTNFIWSSASCISNRRTARLPHFQDWLFQKPSPSRFHVNEPRALTTKDYPFFLRPKTRVPLYRDHILINKHLKKQSFWNIVSWFIEIACWKSQIGPMRSSS